MKEKLVALSNDTILNHVCYADDIVLLAPSVKGLQNLINVCETYGLQFDVKFNESKTKLLTFKTNKYNLNEQNLALNNSNLESVKEIDYLGVYLNEKLSDENEIKKNIGIFVVDQIR